MKKTLRILVMLVTALTACTDPITPTTPIDSVPGTPAPGTTPGQTTEIGKPIGAAVQQTIGLAGGTVSLPLSGTMGQTLTLTFPAGALTTATTIKAQVTENTAPGGVGPAIDLSPKNVKLEKPVTVTWQHGPNGHGTDPLTANKAWGTLNVHDQGAKALYVAPDKLPTTNPVAISVDLETGGRSRVILVANLLITGPGTLIAMGKPYNNPKMSASTNAAGDYLHVSLTEQNPLGDYPAMAFFRIRNFTGKGVYRVAQDPDPDVIINGKEGGKDGKSYGYVYVKGSQYTYTSGSIRSQNIPAKKELWRAPSARRSIITTRPKTI